MCLESRYGVVGEDGLGMLVVGGQYMPLPRTGLADIHYCTFM